MAQTKIAAPITRTPANAARPALDAPAVVPVELLVVGFSQQRAASVASSQGSAVQATASKPFFGRRLWLGTSCPLVLVSRTCGCAAIGLARRRALAAIAWKSLLISQWHSSFTAIISH